MVKRNVCSSESNPVAPRSRPTVAVGPSAVEWMAGKRPCRESGEHEESAPRAVSGRLRTRPGDDRLRRLPDLDVHERHDPAVRAILGASSAVLPAVAGLPT